MSKPKEPEKTLLDEFALAIITGMEADGGHDNHWLISERATVQMHRHAEYAYAMAMEMMRERLDHIPH